MQKKYQAIVFDLDGTLADSIADIAGAMNRTLLHFGFPTHSVENYKLLVGTGLRDLCRKALPADKQTDTEIEACFAYLKADYLEHYLVETTLYPGIAELLDTLKAAQYKLAVLSNKADEITQRIVAKLLSNWSFDQILGSTERFPRKPHPQALFHLLESLQVSASECLYVGDTRVDMQTAQAAGISSVGVAWGFRSVEELQESGANTIIYHPKELLDVALA